MRVRKTAKANRDLKRLYKMIARYDRAAAEKMARRADAMFKQLAQHPYSGTDWSEVGYGLRRVISSMNIIIYRIKPDEIVILRVIDGRMDVEAEFRE